MGFFENLAMRVDDDNKFKATYSFIYLLPVYLLFNFFKFIGFDNNLSIGLSNFLVINLCLVLLMIVSTKIYKNFTFALIFYSTFFLGTFAWTGIQRIFPHDTFFKIILLLILLFPIYQKFLKIILVYCEPIFGAFFIFFKFILENNLKSMLSKIFLLNVIFPITLGILIWVSIIFILIIGYEFEPIKSSLFKRILGQDDPYFFSRLQVFTPFYYYFPEYIQSSFTSLKYGLLPLALLTNLSHQ